MVKLALQNLGTIVREKRATRGLREVAAEVGTSAPTLSRIESGKMPDLQTFGKLCRWLGADPASLLGVSHQLSAPPVTGIAVAHLKAKKEIDSATATALAHAIIRAQQMLTDRPGDEGIDGTWL